MTHSFNHLAVSGLQQGKGSRAIADELFQSPCGEQNNSTLHSPHSTLKKPCGERVATTCGIEFKGSAERFNHLAVSGLQHLILSRNHHAAASFNHLAVSGLQHIDIRAVCDIIKFQSPCGERVATLAIFYSPIGHYRPFQSPCGERVATAKLHNAQRVCNLYCCIYYHKVVRLSIVALRKIYII